MNMTKKHTPISVQLAKDGGGTWKAVRYGFGWEWVCDDGRIVRRYAEPALGFDGYKDDEFNTIYLDQHGRRYFVEPPIFL